MVDGTWNIQIQQGILKHYCTVYACVTCAHNKQERISIKRNIYEGMGVYEKNVNSRLYYIQCSMVTLSNTHMTSNYNMFIFPYVLLHKFQVV